jgi:hypothetical protein
MVLEKDSSILGYPGEISKSLNADHHDVCKYISQEDSNYVSVRNALKSLVGRFRPKGTLWAFAKATISSVAIFTEVSNVRCRHLK